MLSWVMSSFFFFFFFQAEDGIRDLTVTGVQTCALPVHRALGTAKRTLAHGGRRLEQRLAIAHGCSHASAGPGAAVRRTSGAMVWTQVYDPLHSWLLSTLVAALPILVLFGLLAGLKLPPHWCAVAAAATAVLVAVTVF